MAGSGIVSPIARPIEQASHSLASTRRDCGLFANLTTYAFPSLTVSMCDCAPPLMARMWPVAIRKEVDICCGFMEPPQIADGAVLRAGSELPFCELIFRVEKSVEVRPEECYPVRAGCV